MRLPGALARLTVGEWLLLIACAGTIVSGALVPRDLSRGEVFMLDSLEGEYAGYLVSRVVTGLVLAMSGIALLLAVHRRGVSRVGAGLFVAYATWFVTNFVLNAIGRDTPDTWMRTFHQPPVVAALLLTAHPGPRAAVRTAKLVMLAFVYVAIVAAVVAPDLAVARNYEGIVPGLDIRLYGVGGGATSLGSCAFLYLVLELAEPAAGRGRYLHLAASAGVLVASQLKTAWILALLSALLAVTALAEKRILGLRRARPLGPLQGVVLAMAGVAYWAYSDRFGSALALVPADLASNLSTFTGRTWIWEVSLAVFGEHPWFGYGPKLWADTEFFSRYGMFAHSHNQLLQSLASAGLVGAAGLCVYLAVLIRRALRAMPVTLAPFIVLGSILFLGVTDVPLRSDLVLDSYFLLHAILLVTVAAATSAADSRTHAGRAGLRTVAAVAGSALRPAGTPGAFVTLETRDGHPPRP